MGARAERHPLTGYPTLAFAGQPLGSALAYAVSGQGAGYRLSDHFTLGEFRSGDGADRVLVHPALVCVLEVARAHFGAPVTVTSGYRTAAHNRAVGGRPRSRHLYGLAADVVVAGVRPSLVAAFFDGLRVGGLGRYRTFTHVDVQGRRRRW